mgnify:FL=1
MRLYLDIETLPTEDDAVIADIAAGIAPPGNMSKAETIAKWEADAKPALVLEAVKKTSFDATFGRICCIGWAFEDEKADTMMTPDFSEAELLFVFCVKVSERAGRNESRLEVVGHNVSWDLRFMLQRCIVNSVKPPHALMAAMQSRPWGDSICDTMLMWNPERERRISLDRLCKVLGVPTSKGDMDGSKVYDAYRTGEFEKIATYCAADVEATRNVFKRLSFT